MRYLRSVSKYIFLYSTTVNYQLVPPIVPLVFRAEVVADVGQLEASRLSSLENAVWVVLGGDILHESDVFGPVRGQWALCLVGITARLGRGSQYILISSHFGGD